MKRQHKVKISFEPALDDAEYVEALCLLVAGKSSDEIVKTIMESEDDFEKASYQ